jgi:6-phospho-3-hexuloisomerase
LELSYYFKKIISEFNDSISSKAFEDAEKLVKSILDSKRIFVLGAGRSGFMVKAFAMRLAHIGFDAYVIGETIAPPIEENDLLIIGSGSGETESLVPIAVKTKKIKGKIALITISPESSIGSIADILIKIDAVSPKVEDKINDKKSILPGASLFEISMLLLLESVVLKLIESLNRDPDSLFTRHANVE